MISATKLKFLWPRAKDVWDVILADLRLAPMFSLRGTWRGRVMELTVLTLMYTLGIASLLVPRFKLLRLCDTARRGLGVRWLFWMVYVGPELPLPPPGMYLTEEQIRALANCEHPERLTEEQLLEILNGAKREDPL